MLRKMTETEIKQGLKFVLSKIEEACSRRTKEVGQINPRLVAVSKTKPVESIIEAYEAGQRHFGENYVQELEEKAYNKQILEKCKEIKWHFIGHLQGNKVNKVVNVPNLYIIETVDSQKLARKLNNSCTSSGEGNSKLRVFIQVNTSGEKEKSGCIPNDIIDMVSFVKNECPNLQIDGLMTIGDADHSQEAQNPDFLKLIQCKKEVCQKFNIPEEEFELSMGMSGDFEHAIEMGSTNVRVGSAIFGYRAKKNT
ncbi:pyridoxal phosphate homeostasis protein [Harmonia axyridis]|uniref:pyridoxal phosphate homeostasis protein n=1 Tax=Harmonia axyridis TaxID=115357 RepID=UPI001E2756FC|nr:pyridoxal phosphate homeostasis protein [Harmonia axyridis]